MQIKRLSEAIWEIPKEDSMKNPALIIGTEKIVKGLKHDRTLQQLKNVASLPVIKNAVLMPDGHEGYGFPIGGVAAFDAEEGIISPGGIGYDINCGVRLLKSDLQVEEIKPGIKNLMNELFKNVPSGVGESGKLKLNINEFDDVVELGIDWTIEHAFAYKQDKERIEENGKMEGASHTKVSKKAKKRGHVQLGTLGAGNHFLEVQYVDAIYDENVAKAFGLYKDQVVVMIHTGSRGFGHQIASDYVNEFMPIARKLGLYLPDPELVYLPLKEQKAQDYIKAFKAAVNFAFANRQIITYFVREVFEKLGTELELLYDVAHNIAKFEEHYVNNKKQKLIVHRKGATRAFPAGREEIPSIYRNVGQPVLIPGSMGTASYVLVGMPDSLEVSFGSSCHGAGRRLSRRKALHNFRGEALINSLWKEKNIYVKPKTFKVAAEEAPQAYKDVDEVAKSVEKAGISKIVARLKPLGVVKG